MGWQFIHPCVRERVGQGGVVWGGRLAWHLFIELNGLLHTQLLLVCGAHQFIRYAVFKRHSRFQGGIIISWEFWVNSRLFVKTR